MDAKTLDRFMAAYNVHDLTGALDFFTEDASYHSHAGPDAWVKVITDDLRPLRYSRPDSAVPPIGRIVLTEPAFCSVTGAPQSGTTNLSMI